MCPFAADEGHEQVQRTRAGHGGVFQRSGRLPPGVRPERRRELPDAGHQHPSPAAQRCRHRSAHRDLKFLSFFILFISSVCFKISVCFHFFHLFERIITLSQSVVELWFFFFSVAVTGACFFVFSGALKASSGFLAKTSIVEGEKCDNQLHEKKKVIEFICSLC